MLTLVGIDNTKEESLQYFQVDAGVEVQRQMLLQVIADTLALQENQTMSLTDLGQEREKPFCQDGVLETRPRLEGSGAKGEVGTC